MVDASMLNARDFYFLYCYTLYKYYQIESEVCGRQHSGTKTKTEREA